MTNPKAFCQVGKTNFSKYEYMIIEGTTTWKYKSRWSMPKRQAIIVLILKVYCSDKPVLFENVEFATSHIHL